RGKLVAETCPAIPEALALLREKGKLLGLASGNLESVGWLKVEAAGLRHFFSFGCFADVCEMRTGIFQHAAGEARRLAGAEGSICFVGDTPDDIEAARAADAHVIAVGTGIYPVKDLSALHPDVCVGSFADLLASAAD
ncbi:MAG TPA: HAD hydrolase-like protein, partial [Terriglobales bacterium]|nr:HAD hydrolase-like protein [Terriglobales bacterium]